MSNRQCACICAMVCVANQILMAANCHSCHSLVLLLPLSLLPQGCSCRLQDEQSNDDGRQTSVQLACIVTIWPLSHLRNKQKNNQPWRYGLNERRTSCVLVWRSAADQTESGNGYNPMQPAAWWTNTGHPILQEQGNKQSAMVVRMRHENKQSAMLVQMQRGC